MKGIIGLLLMAALASIPAAELPGTVADSKAGTVIDAKAVRDGDYFTIQEIPDDVFRRMQGKSFGRNCTVKREELRYLRLLHCNMNGETQVGEMVCNRRIASSVVEIFRQLYKGGYRIERMVLIDEYDADDERSMAANNTSCFNFRLMTGSRTRVSLHGMGMAIDINPLYNPYVSSKGRVSPAKGKAYAVRSRGSHPGHEDMIIRSGDLCHRLFIKHGFSWGGAWKTHKDYQHFQREK